MSLKDNQKMLLALAIGYYYINYSSNKQSVNRSLAKKNAIRNLVDRNIMLNDAELNTLDSLIIDLETEIKVLDKDKLENYLKLLNMLKGTNYTAAQIVNAYGENTTAKFIKIFELTPAINGLYWEKLPLPAKKLLKSMGYTPKLWDNIDL
jgi:hypothetical protein